MDKRMLSATCGAAAAFVGLFCVSSFAQPKPSVGKPHATQKLCEAALAKVMEEEPEAAFAVMAPHCSISESTFRSLKAQVCRKLTEADSILGKKLAFEPNRARAGNDSSR